MARKPRRRIKFQPFRMSERFQRTMLVALGVFLMVIFAVPAGTCLRRQRGRREGRDPQALALRLGGRRITYGEIDEVRLRWSLILGDRLALRFGRRADRQGMTDSEALQVLAHVQEAERLGIRVSNAQVLDALRNELFPRLVTVEYLVAKHSDFEGKAERALAAIVAARTQIAGLLGAPLRGALERVAAERKLARAETRGFSARTALDALGPLREVPRIVERAFNDDIGAVSEPVQLSDRACLFRVTTRTIGFGPDGFFYPEHEGWAGEGYGTGEVKPYDQHLRDRRMTQAQIEQTLREDILFERIERLYAEAAVGPTDPHLGEPDGSGLPEATVRDRYVRDYTQAVAAHFTLHAGDFTHTVTCSEDELRSFYEQHKSIERTEDRIGYLQPERVAIEYVLGRKEALEQSLSERELREGYEHNKDEFKDPYEKALPAVRARLADQALKRLIGGLAAEAAEKASRRQDPNLPDLAARASRQAPGAFVARTSDLFPARDFEKIVPDLRGAKLSDELFGDKGKQYLVAGDDPKEGARFVSPDLDCEDGRFFFRVLRREPAAEVPYDRISPATRDQLVQDLTQQKAATAAQDKAREYRTRIFQAAFDALAAKTGAKPADTDYLLADTAVPPVGKPVPELYGELALAPAGHLSKVVQEGDRFLVARLVEREDTKGLKLQLLAFREADLPPSFAAAYEPALYEQQARYDDDPYPFLDKPKPVPFEKVKDSIAQLLARRRVLALAAERVAAAHKEAAATKDAQLAGLAAKHKLLFTADVKVDLAHPEAAPQVGKAAGFRDALAALKPGELSQPLASAEGRFLLRLKARDERAATLDLLAAPYDRLRPEGKVEDKDIQKHYDDCRDTAYVTDDEIKEAPAWSDLADAVRQRVAAALRDPWAKQPLRERLARLRAALLLDAFRTVPPKHPLESRRTVPLRVQQPSPFKPDDPPAAFSGQAELVTALGKLKPGEVSQPLETRIGAILALLKEQKPDKTLGLVYVPILSWEWDEAASADEPTEAALQKHYEAHQDTFRTPDELQVEYLAVPYDDLIKKLPATDDEVRKEYDRGVRERDLAYRDPARQPEYTPLPFEQVKDLARRQVLNRKARAEAERLLGEARQALGAPGAAPDFKPVAAKLPPLEAGLSAFFQRDRRTLHPVGLAPDLIEKAFAAKDGELIGPFYGLDGACLARRHEFHAARVPPFGEVHAAVLADHRRREANRQALAAAAALRPRVTEAVAKVADKDKAEAFRAAVEASPFPITVPTPVRVSVTDPFYAVGSPMSRLNSGPARDVRFADAAFGLRVGQFSDVILAEDGATCYVATPTRFLAPGPPNDYQLFDTRRRLAQATFLYLRGAWQAHIEEQTTSR